MSIAVRRFQDSDDDALQRLNDRLAGGTQHRLHPEDLTQNPTADLEIRPINHALFVVADGEEIRGGAWLCEQYFWIDGSRHRVGWMKYPVSESLIDRQFAGVPASMLFQLLRQQPHLMVIGMGGHGAPFARLLAGIGWKASTIPMFFGIARPFRVLRGLTYARRRWWVRIGMDVAAWTGMGWLAHRLYLLGAGGTESKGVTVTPETRFTPWADEIWYASRDAYQALAVRDAKTLDYLYDQTVPNLDRLRVARDGASIGWACTQLLEPGEDTVSYFGNLRVGIVTDVLARPEDATVVLSAGVRHLEKIGADLVVTYLSHASWIAAARRLRLLRGPSTFTFYRSTGAEQLVAGGAVETRCHLTRSDGDGPRR